MDNDGILIFAHLMVVFSTFLPILIMKFVDLERPNQLVGYRTPWSLKSADTWRYANKKSTEFMTWAAIGTVSVQVISFILTDSATSILIAAGVMTAGIIAAMIKTELGLRRNFNKKGEPKIDLDRY